ncbi:MAG: hypothetical protein R3C42_08635 [Parvularculaceae bacterium]
MSKSPPMFSSLDFRSESSFKPSASATGAAIAFAFVYAALFAYMSADPGGLFVIDESLYVAIADAMATRGELAIQGGAGVDGAPALMFALSD